MNLRTVTENRQGSCTVEAAMMLPVLILCVCALALVINVIGICEKITFITSEQMLDIDLNAYKLSNTVSLCKEIESRVLKENLTNFDIRRFKYLYDSGSMTDLILIETGAEFNVANPIGIYGNIKFSERLVTRGFTGTTRDESPLPEEEFKEDKASCRVIVFPKYGKRYNRENCIYVKRQKDNSCVLEMDRREAKRRGYTPCEVCGGAADVR